jgi:hypothetical protein
MLSIVHCHIILNWRIRSLPDGMLLEQTGNWSTGLIYDCMDRIMFADRQLREDHTYQ